MLRCAHLQAHSYHPYVRQRPFLGVVVMVMPLRESRVYVYKGSGKTRTRAHNAHVAGLLQVTATIRRSHFPFAFTFPQVGRARSVRIPVRVLRTGSERGVVETPKSPMEPIRSYLCRACP